jgi:sulfate transport system ATP-binding protein
VVINQGRVEQSGAPRELYEEPASEFVMRFVGPVNDLGDALVRPHDIDILLERADGASEAIIDRIVHLGFEVRVELSLADGRKLNVQITRARAAELELASGQIVFARPHQGAAFENGNGSPSRPGLGVARELGD